MYYFKETKNPVLYILTLIKEIELLNNLNVDSLLE